MLTWMRQIDGTFQRSGNLPRGKHHFNIQVLHGGRRTFEDYGLPAISMTKTEAIITARAFLRASRGLVGLRIVKV